MLTIEHAVDYCESGLAVFKGNVVDLLKIQPGT